MANTDYANGCVGCVDYGINARTCDYLLNNGHCRPCKADINGCEMYSGCLRGNVSEETCCTWSTEQVRRMLKGGQAIHEVAQQVGASLNSLKAWIVKGMPVYRRARRRKAGAEQAERAAKGVWNEEVYRTLYEKGLTDPEAAERMGLNHQTVWKHRRRLGLPANGKKKKELKKYESQKI